MCTHSEKIVATLYILTLYVINLPISWHGHPGAISGKTVVVEVRVRPVST
jgi:hypothetical protein